MKLEAQVCSLELAQKLKSLNVKQESLFYHVDKDGHDSEIVLAEYRIPKKGLFAGKGLGGVSAFTVAELGEMLSTKENNNMIRTVMAFTAWVCDYETHRTSGDTEADARAKMLIYLIENGLVTLTK